MTEDQQEHRDAFALALRQVADKVCDNPDWPVDRYPRIDVSAAAADEGGVEEVDRAAAAMGVEPRWNDGHTHYTAEVKVGPFHYRIAAITSASMDEYYAAQKVADEWKQQQRGEKTP